MNKGCDFKTFEGCNAIQRLFGPAKEEPLSKWNCIPDFVKELEQQYQDGLLAVDLKKAFEKDVMKVLYDSWKVMKVL